MYIHVCIIALQLHQTIRSPSAPVDSFIGSAPPPPPPPAAAASPLPPPHLEAAEAE